MSEIPPIKKTLISVDENGVFRREQGIPAPPCSPELANLRAYAAAENRTKIHAIRERDEARALAERFRSYIPKDMVVPLFIPWENGENSETT